MNVNLANVPADAIERALKRFNDRAPAVRIIERAPGCVIGGVECRGTCGLHALIEGEHTVQWWWDLTIVCDCVTPPGFICYHAAGLIDAEGGTVPDAPEPDRVTLPDGLVAIANRYAVPGTDETIVTWRAGQPLPDGGLDGWSIADTPEAAAAKYRAMCANGSVSAHIHVCGGCAIVIPCHRPEHDGADSPRWCGHPKCEAAHLASVAEPEPEVVTSFAALLGVA